MLFLLPLSVFAYDAIINLGGDCQVVHQLYINGLRQYALPFDTLITPYQTVRDLLLNRFEGFMEPENFEFRISEQGEKYILDTKYGSRWIHDFVMQEDFLKDYDAVADKYIRRIDRFLEILITSSYPLFIRKRITKEQAQELRDILENLRNGRPFLLVALDGTQEMKADWQLESVRNYYLRKAEPYTWKGDNQAWQEIFHDLGLKTSDYQASSRTMGF